ncbi:DUF2279 domain-containing protein [Chitinophaga silvatica]|uniref:DUF2279 domain-containing protein n=1 Tax=Chitinophaga silvatica TaxID=2282649 RepID=A0A3E1YFW8_9BACT|nr:DUF2279 domain-containing protein [Chitinophaga silvatica]RFS26287.1 DUF2279 domain-containing protein [Chitinophaga silvatica]
MKKYLLLITLALLCYRSTAQKKEPFFSIPDTVSPGHIWILGGASLTLYGTSLAALNTAWYKGYPRSSFHFFNDMNEWLQMDKAGHIFTAYIISKYNRELWKWSGLSRKQQIWIGGFSGLGYQSVIEILDGFSSEWGFSWGDMGANAVGSALMVSQELIWNEQRIQLKFSAHPEKYDDPLLKEKAENLFGPSFWERTLKDYNGQTYWLSVNLHSFAPQSNWPKWLNISAGYGAKGMLGGDNNIWTDDHGITRNYTHIKRVRQFYLSPDIDFTKIKTRKKGVKVLFQLLNMVKVPAPALEFNSEGKVKVHALAF